MGWWNSKKDDQDDERDDDRSSKNSGYPSTQVGGRTMYPDNQGMLHTTPGGAVSEDMRTEGDMSRGASGGCGQDADNVPNTDDDR